MFFAAEITIFLLRLSGHRLQCQVSMCGVGCRGFYCPFAHGRHELRSGVEAGAMGVDLHFGCTETLCKLEITWKITMLSIIRFICLVVSNMFYFP